MSRGIVIDTLYFKLHGSIRQRSNKRQVLHAVLSVLCMEDRAETADTAHLFPGELDMADIPSNIRHLKRLQCKITCGTLLPLDPFVMVI